MFDLFVDTVAGPTELCALMEKYGSDKGQKTPEGGRNWHNYTLFYYPLFEEFRTNPLRIFEMGLGTNNVNVASNMGPQGKPGASLRGWRDFFPNALVFGADIDKDILIKEDRIDSFYCDQTSPASIQALWSIPALSEPFDIILDDGLHTFDANKTLFDESFSKVKPGGVYIIEDVECAAVQTYVQYLHTFKQSHPIKFRVIQLPHHRNKHDNCLIVIQRI